jgi:hypothetical protein
MCELGLWLNTYLTYFQCPSISSSFFIYFEGETMLNIFGSLLSNYQVVELKTITKLLYMQFF